MLYNKTWDEPVKTPEQLMDLPNIIKWLEQRPFGARYNFWSTSNCLLAQYYKDHGYEDVMVIFSYVLPEGRRSLYSGEEVVIPYNINRTIRGGLPFFGRSFKGALKRARRLLQQERAYAF